jgi:hypothetical protein
MFGRTLLSNSNVQPTRVSADNMPIQKPGGVTIDWTNTVTAPGSDVTLPDGSVIKSGSKYLRYGQVLCRITTGTTQTFTGTATGGTFTYTFVRPDNGQSVTTAALAFNATAAQVLAAIQAVAGPGQAVSASGGALGTAGVVVTYGTTTALGTVNAGSLTGGTVTVAQTTAGATAGYFGPYDPAASDGRQSLNKGDCFVLDQTYLQYGLAGSTLTASNDQIGNCIEGGLIFIDRVLQSGTAAHSLALGPTLAEFSAAFPRFGYAKN